MASTSSSFLLMMLFASHFLSANGFLRPSVVRISLSSIGTTRQHYAASSVKLGATTEPRSSTAELSKLATELGVSSDKVRELLIGQRRKLIGTEAKAKHIDWLLTGKQDQPKRLFATSTSIGTEGSRSPNSLKDTPKPMKQSLAPIKPSKPAPLSTSTNGSTK